MGQKFFYCALACSNFFGNVIAKHEYTFKVTQSEAYFQNAFTKGSYCSLVSMMHAILKRANPNNSFQRDTLLHDVYSYIHLSHCAIDKTLIEQLHSLKLSLYHFCFLITMLLSKIKVTTSINSITVLLLKLLCILVVISIISYFRTIHHIRLTLLAISGSTRCTIIIRIKQCLQQLRNITKA